MVEEHTGGGDLEKALDAAKRVAKRASWLPHEEPKEPAGFGEPPALAYDYADRNASKNDPQREDNVAEILQLLKDIADLDLAARAKVTIEEAQLKNALKTGKTDRVNTDRIREAIEAAVREIEATKAETPQAKVDRLWGEIKALDKKIEKNVESLHASGLISDEEYEELKKKKAALDKMDISDPARRALEKEYTAHLKRLGIEAGNEADRRGDEAGKRVADNTANQADERKEKIIKLEEAIKHHEKVFKETGTTDDRKSDMTKRRALNTLSNDELTENINWLAKRELNAQAIKKTNNNVVSNDDETGFPVAEASEPGAPAAGTPNRSPRSLS